MTLLDGYRKKHPNLESDIEWLKGRLRQAPELIGDRIQKLDYLHPVYKARCKDSCCRISASGGWRVFYRVIKESQKVELFFLCHKREIENPGPDYIRQQIERAFP
jgi:hypothetical protein